MCDSTGKYVFGKSNGKKNVCRENYYRVDKHLQMCVALDDRFYENLCSKNQKIDGIRKRARVENNAKKRPNLKVMCEQWIGVDFLLVVEGFWRSFNDARHEPGLWHDTISWLICKGTVNTKWLLPGKTSARLRRIQCGTSG